MSTAYFIVLDNEDPGFDPFVNGKFVAQEASKLDRISKKLGIKKIHHYCSQDFCEFGSLSKDTQDSGSKWFPAVEGIEWAGKLIDYLKINPDKVKNSEGVISDLNEYLSVFKKAKSANLKWHFNIDI